MRRVLPCLAALALLLPAAAHAAPPAGPLVLDAFADPLPPHPCLPVSSQPIVFTGPWCDGASCPPGALVSCGASSWSSQSGLAGVAGGAREVGLGGTGSDAQHALVDPAAHRFVFTTADPSNGAGFWLDYSGGVSDWNLDFTGMGIAGIGMDLGGAVSASQPVTCWLLLVDHATGAAQATVEFSSPGPVTVPLGAFGAPPGFDWGGIDLVRVGFVNCVRPYACPAPWRPRTYTIGPPELTTAGVVPARRGSWGTLKSRYR